MSTRGVYTFTDGRGSYSVYKHHDNYPQGKHGGLVAIKKALPFAWQLPRFEADDFACAFIKANHSSPAECRLMKQADSIGGIEYYYIIKNIGAKIHVRIDGNETYEGFLDALLETVR